MPNSFLEHLISVACNFFRMSAVNVQVSRAYKRFEMVRGRGVGLYNFDAKLGLTLMRMVISLLETGRYPMTVQGTEISPEMRLRCCLSRINQQFFFLFFCLGICYSHYFPLI